MARRANATLIRAFVLRRAIRTLDAARDALPRAETSLNQVDGVLDGNSSLGYQLVDTLNELKRAARARRALSEEIDRQPNVLIFGRGGVKE